MRITALSAVFGLLIVAACAVGAKHGEDAPAAPPSAPPPKAAGGTGDADIQRMIEDLGSDDWRTREKAGRDLAAKGEKALPHMRAVLLATENPEVQRRLSVLVRKLDRDRLVEPKRVTYKRQGQDREGGLRGDREADRLQDRVRRRAGRQVLLRVQQRPVLAGRGRGRKRRRVHRLRRVRRRLDPHLQPGRDQPPRRLRRPVPVPRHQHPVQPQRAALQPEPAGQQPANVRVRQPELPDQFRTEEPDARGDAAGIDRGEGRTRGRCCPRTATTSAPASTTAVSADTTPT